MICSVEKVISNKEISEGIFEMTIEGKYKAEPGQFYMIKSLNKEPILPRPISVNGLSENYIKFLYKKVGEGTEILSRIKENQYVQLMGPLGNCFNIEKLKGKIALVSGGIGIAPLVYLTKKLKNKQVDFYAGFKEEIFAVDNVEKNVNNIYISTEKLKINKKSKEFGVQNQIMIVDNSFITSLLDVSKYDYVICCGPEIMMKKVINMCKKQNVKVLVSMENRMACGIGACLGCTCHTKNGNERVCKEGPIFNGEDLIFNE